MQKKKQIFKDQSPCGSPYCAFGLGRARAQVQREGATNTFASLGRYIPYQCNYNGIGSFAASIGASVRSRHVSSSYINMPKPVLAPNAPIGRVERTRYLCERDLPARERVNSLRDAIATPGRGRRTYKRPAPLLAPLIRSFLVNGTTTSAKKPSRSAAQIVSSKREPQRACVL